MKMKKKEVSSTGINQKSQYKPSEIEAKWQKNWEEEGIYRPNLGNAKKPFYNLMMFPYPSAEGMHVGNMYAFTGSDIYGRFKRMQGYDVFEPIGLDGFGIHSENYAIKVGRHPKDQAALSEKNFYRQLRSIGNGFDWSRTVETYKPEYYKWTQWIFIQLFKKGLAYRKKAPVNFCPKDLTVLADEQVIDGKCERCSSVVEKRQLSQWFFRITEYADALLDGLNKIDWTEKVKIAQREWIGKSKGASIIFSIEGKKETVEVFTTRPDTLYGATFLVIAPEHPLVSDIKSKDVKDYIKAVKNKTEQERKAEDKEKTGVFSGLYAINPLHNEKLPIWIADYALMGYGTGALFGDAHDERDVAFARKYNIPLKATIVTGDEEKDKRILNLTEVYTGYGTLVDSGEFTGLSSKEAMEKVILWLEKHKKGSAKTTYHLRDWLISRQRYWGPPIPMIYCDKPASPKTASQGGCGWQPVPEDQLPVLLPEVTDWKPKGTGESPLASIPDFVKATCPNCGGVAKRETDVSDTFLDSAWYFFRYINTDIDTVAFSKERDKKWLPVNMYIGGAEHSVLHLLYTRFLTKVFCDVKLIDFDEPFPRFFAHGLIIKDGAKMSKSKGNVVVPDEYIRKYGSDTVRSYLMFSGPFSQGGDFRDSGVEGMHKFLKRVWRLVAEVSSEKQSTGGSDQLDRAMHAAAKKVTEDLGMLHYNTAIAASMEFYNALIKEEKHITKSHLEALLLFLAPFAPHMTEELWKEVLRNTGSIHVHSLPTFDPKMLETDEVTVVVQVNGKVRDALKVERQKITDQKFIEKKVAESERVRSHLNGKKIQKIVYIPGKIISYSVSI